MPEALEQSGFAAYGGLFYIFGGNLNTVPYVYDPVSDSWSTRAPDSNARCDTAAISYNGKIHVIGGQLNCDFNTPTTVHRVYDPVANTWSNAASALVARGDTAYGLIGGKFYLTGGGASFPGAFNQTEIYDPVTDAWSFGAPIPIAVRRAGSAVIDGKLYVVSGQDAGFIYRPEVQIYDPVSNSWSYGAPIPTPRHSPLVGVIDGKMYAATGYNGSALTTLEIYDIASNSWTTGPSSTTPRWIGASAVIDSKFYIAEGRSTVSGDTTSLEVFTPEAPTPTPTPTPVCTSPPPNMVSWWPGDGNANDIQGGNNGSLQIGATFAPGKVAQAFSFDGVDDFVTVPNSSNLNLTQALTIDAWVHPSVANQNGGIVEKTVGDHVNTQYLMDLEGGVVFFRVIVVPGVDHRTVHSNSVIPINQWTHIAGTWDGAIMKLFINGIQQTETVEVTPPINSGNGPTRIGSLGDNIYHFAGLIDEVEIFSRALSTEEIVALYLADSAGKCKNIDQCPDDPNKIAPGACGCGVPDTDSDGDGIADCRDVCPNNFNPDQTDSDGDGVGDLCDTCGNDPNKVAPGACGCNVPDTDSDNDGEPDCFDACPTDPNKTSPGLCGCGNVDTDTDDDGTADCSDACPNDRNKIAPGACGCGFPDTDTDGDGTPNCSDACPNDPNKIAQGACGCGIPDTDSDGDGVPNCHDNCPATFNPDQQDSNGDGVGDVCTPIQIPPGGMFVIGDQVSLVNGATVNFWGSQWAQNNPMSGGAPPNSFKGFENGTATAACGGNWTTVPGNSSNPPATVPQYLTIIVSSSIQKNGSVLSGDIKKIVVVRTNPGYGPSPGHPGTGQIVEILCVTNQPVSMLHQLWGGPDSLILPARVEWLDRRWWPAS